MSYVEYLRRQRDSYAAVWLSFVHAYRPGVPELYVFVEGSDDLSFYMPELRRRAACWPIVRPFVCNGKRTVLKVLSVVRPKLDYQWRALFLVDKDIDDLLNAESTPLNDPYVFRTTFYSVENYLVTEEVLACIWTDLLQLPDANPRKDQARDYYRRVRRNALRKLKVIMAWSVFHRVHNRRPNLKNVNLNKLLEVSLPGNVYWKTTTILELDQACGVETPRNCWRSILNAARRLNAPEPKTFIRGKYELWMFVQIVDRIVEHAAEGGLFWTGTSPCRKTPVTTSSAVALLAGRIPPPVEVREFFDCAARLTSPQVAGNMA